MLYIFLDTASVMYRNYIYPSRNWYNTFTFILEKIQERSRNSASPSSVNSESTETLVAGYCDTGLAKESRDLRGMLIQVCSPIFSVSLSAFLNTQESSGVLYMQRNFDVIGQFF